MTSVTKLLLALLCFYSLCLTSVKAAEENNESKIVVDQPAELKTVFAKMDAASKALEETATLLAKKPDFDKLKPLITKRNALVLQKLNDSTTKVTDGAKLHDEISTLYTKLYAEDTAKDPKESIDWFKQLLCDAAEEGLNEAIAADTERNAPENLHGEFAAFKEEFRNKLQGYSKLTAETEFVALLGGDEAFASTQTFVATLLNNETTAFDIETSIEDCQKAIETARATASTKFEELEKALGSSHSTFSQLLKDFGLVFKAQGIKIPSVSTKSTHSSAEIKKCFNFCNDALAKIKETKTKFENDFAAYSAAVNSKDKKKETKSQEAWLKYHAIVTAPPQTGGGNGGGNGDKKKSSFWKNTGLVLLVVGILVAGAAGTWALLFRAKSESSKAAA